MIDKYIAVGCMGALGLVCIYGAITLFITKSFFSGVILFLMGLLILANIRQVVREYDYYGTKHTK